MIKYIKSYFTLREIGFAFKDCISGKDVKYYRDCYNVIWMKDNRWAFFRVPSNRRKK